MERPSPSILLLFAAGVLVVLLLETLALAGWQGGFPGRTSHPPQARPLPDRGPVEVAALEPLDDEAAAQERPVDRYYRELRAQVRRVPQRLGNELLLTLDIPSRLLLAKSAAQRARLEEVGLGFADVYGIINAESSWLPRDGASRDGTPNLGIAQFEPATAAALGVRDPHDEVEAVHAAAEHIREAALWSASRIAGLKLGKAERAERLREGVSVYYNLSSRARAAWDGRDASLLPQATHVHIRNARQGAQEAAWLEARARAEDAGRRGRGRAVVTAAVQSAP